MRAVDLNSPIVSNGLKNGSRTEDRRKYLPYWETRVTSGRVNTRFRSPLPQAPHEMG